MKQRLLDRVNAFSAIPINLGSDALRNRGGTTALVKGCSAILEMVAVMNRSGQQSSNLLLTLASSYSRDLKHWLGVLTTRYAAGAGLLASGVVFLIIAAGIATSAAFHALEIHYGAYVAYGIVGGMFLLLGVSGLVAGRMMLSRPTTPLPTPRRQFQVLKQSITAPAAAALVAQGGRRAGRIDPVSRGLAIGAAAVLLGWIAANKLQREPNSRRG